FHAIPEQKLHILRAQAIGIILEQAARKNERGLRRDFFPRLWIEIESWLWRRCRRLFPLNLRLPAQERVLLFEQLLFFVALGPLKLLVDQPNLLAHRLGFFAAF